MGAEEAVMNPGILVDRTRFEDYIGLYVMHCHRLNHEDNGLMALDQCHPGGLDLRGGDSRRAGQAGRGPHLRRQRRPFAGHGHSVSRILRARQRRHGRRRRRRRARPHRWRRQGPRAGSRCVYRGSEAAAARSAPRLARFQAFAAGRGGVSVAAAQIDGTTVDNIIVASGAGIAGEVKVIDPRCRPLPVWRRRSSRPSSLIGDDRTGVSVATGFVDFCDRPRQHRHRAGAGSAAEVKVFAFPLLKPIGAAASADGHRADQ